MGVSVDNVHCLTAWAKSLEGITYPLAADFWPHGEVARAWGVFREDEGISERAIFLIDADGRVRYVDVHDIENQPENEVLFAQIEALEPERAAAWEVQAKAQEAANEEAAGAAEVVMYCTPYCADCRDARKWFEQHSIEYMEIDVSKDRVARERAAAHNEGRLHTPTFEIGSEVCVDFRPERLKDLLGVDDDRE